jgi:CubicO group peptidase (beta-lactamase class C family)
MCDGRLLMIIPNSFLYPFHKSVANYYKLWPEICHLFAMKYAISFLLVTSLIACQKQERPPVALTNEELYFPTNVSWEQLDKSVIGIDNNELHDLRTFLSDNNSRAFLILKNGKIVIEEYFGKQIQNNQDFDKDSYWYWASAGKGLTAFTVGLAQEEGFLNINNKTSDYLGQNWTSIPKVKQDLITVKHQLSMTSGLDLDVPDSHCYQPECLQYKADAGTRWDYHNGSYTSLHNVVSKATDQSFEDFFKEKLRDKIGMDGFWQFVQNDHVYFSKPRSFARFGILMLNMGDWNGESVMYNKTYFQEMTNTSQNLNEAYGYLWWLNGKSTRMLPGIEQVFKTALCPNAPMDMFAAMGKNGQLLDIIPSQNLIVIRMGDAPGDQIGLTFQNEFWAILSKAMAE